MATKQTDFPDLNGLAIEACDMWQEHLATLATDPAARADLTRFLEPQRRMFADWASMMQQGGKTESPSTRQNAAGNPATPDPGQASAAATAAPTASGGAAHGDDPLRVAQLALRLAELEKRVAQLESKTAGAPRRTQRAAS